MTSKLDYLKKYLAGPKEGGGTDAAAPGKKSSGGAKPVKEKKKKSRGPEMSMQIRDMSEVLPAAREDKRKTTIEKLLAKEKDPDAVPGSADIEFVDEELVEQAKKATASETSGIKWKIQQHRKPPAKQALKPVVKDEDEGGASGSDLDVARPAKKVGAPPRGRPPVKAPVAQDGDSDISPPRGGQAPPAKRKARHDSDSDISPPRGGQAPPAKRKSGGGGGGADSDLSPPRGAKAEVKDEPVKRESGVKEEPNSDDDVSPPRKPAGKKATSGKKARHDSDSDISVARPSAGGAGGGRQRHDSDADLSPPRKAAESKRKRHDSDSDISPPRGGGGDQPEEEEKMSSGLRAGLVSGQKLREEAAQVRAERRAAVEAMPDDETGKGAQTVYRSKEGSKITREEWVGQQQKQRKKKLSEYPEQELEWGGGLKQKARKEEEMAELERVAAQPFARYAPDEKYIEELKGKQDWNDPMRKFADDDLGGPGGAEPAKKPKPKCPHAPWPNRFNILPGYRWDGKVRGNDYEKKWLETKNTRALKKKEAWMQDMEEQ